MKKTLSKSIFIIKYTFVFLILIFISVLNFMGGGLFQGTFMENVWPIFSLIFLIIALSPSVGLVILLCFPFFSPALWPIFLLISFLVNIWFWRKLYLIRSVSIKDILKSKFSLVLGGFLLLNFFCIFVILYLFVFNPSSLGSLF